MSIPFLSALLVLIGLFIHLTALSPLHRLIAMLPSGTLRNKWLAIAGMIVIFIASDLGYIIVLWGQQNKWRELPIPGLFLLGAIYVWVTIKLSLQTAVELQRMDVLEAESITDPLTKLYNRRYLDRRIEEEVARSKRHSLDLSVLMLDIDHFKHVNDTYGHQVGDAILSTLANVVKEDIRDIDTAARYGGEEFLIICANTPIDVAALLAERLRRQVELHHFQFIDHSGRNQSIQITISIGLAGFNASIDNKESLIQRADQALYRAKEKGRNCLSIA